MTYKTNWLAGILAPIMFFATQAFAIQANMAGSQNHTVFIDNGSVFAMGSNRYGEIQSAATTEFRTPTFTSISNATSVAANQFRTMVLKDDRTAVLNGVDWLTWSPRSVQVPASNITDIAITRQGTFYISGGQVYTWDTINSPMPLMGGANATAIAAGNEHLVVLFANGTVGVYGGNSAGQLGVGNNVAAQDITLLTLEGPADQIAAGAFTTFIRLANGKIFAAGKNTQSQLGLGDAVNKTLLTVVPNLGNVRKMLPGDGSTLMLMNDGTVAAAGWHNYIEGALYNTSTSFTRMPVGFALDAMAAADQMILDVGTNGQRAGWGGNMYGKLGDSTNTERHVLTVASFTPIAPPVVATPVVTPTVVVAEVPAPAASEPEVSGMPMALPYEAPPTVIAVSPTTSTVISVVSAVVEVVNTVVQAVETVVQAVVSTVQAVVEYVAPAPVVVATPAPVVVTPPVVSLPAVIVQTQHHDRDHDDNHDKSCAKSDHDKKHDHKGADKGKAKGHNKSCDDREHHDNRDHDKHDHKTLVAHR